MLFRSVLYDSHPARRRTLSPAIARTVNQVLEQVVTRGTGLHARIGRPVAGKTGTGQDYKDAWFVGSVPQLTAAVWVGFADKPRSMLAPATRIKVTGGSWPADIWARFMGAATADMPIADFPSPPADATDNILPTAPLPDVVGMPVDQAGALLHDAGYDVATQSEPSGDYPPGTVLAQTPGARVAVRAGTIVTLTVATDSAATTTVPVLLDLTAAEAAAAGTAAAVTVNVVVAPEPPPASAARRGRVWKQSIASATAVARGTAVTVWVDPT